MSLALASSAPSALADARACAADHEQGQPLEPGERTVELDAKGMVPCASVCSSAKANAPASSAS